MSERSVMATALVTAACVVAGCNVNGNPGPRPTVLLSVTGRTIPAGQEALAFVIHPDAGRRVTISVQASTDRADPDFRVVRGEIDFDDLADTPISDLVLISEDQDSGQEIGFFTPESADPFTIFITDRNDWPGAAFSVTATQ